MTWTRPVWIFGKPDVIVDFEFEHGCFFLVITNNGTRPAHDISTTFDPSFSGVGGRRQIPSLCLFENIGFLPPEKEIRTFVDAAEPYFAREEPDIIRTDVSFHDSEGRSFRNRATHDLGIYRDLPYVESQFYGPE